MFDENVDAAVRAFQQRRGLIADGCVGPLTERELVAARWALGDRTLSYTLSAPMSGDDVVELQQRLAELQAQLDPLQSQINQLSRQFWVTREQVKQNRYDLSASRYRQVEQDEEYYERPEVTIERMLRLEKIMEKEIHELREVK